MSSKLLLSFLRFEVKFLLFDLTLNMLSLFHEHHYRSNLKSFVFAQNVQVEFDLVNVHVFDHV